MRLALCASPVVSAHLHFSAVMIALLRCVLAHAAVEGLAGHGAAEDGALLAREASAAVHGAPVVHHEALSRLELDAHLELGASGCAGGR